MKKKINKSEWGNEAMDEALIVCEEFKIVRMMLRRRLLAKGVKKTELTDKWLDSAALKIVKESRIEVRQDGVN